MKTTKTLIPLFALFLLFPTIRAQSPQDPPRPTVRNPQKEGEKETLLQSLLRTLAEVRAERARADGAARAFNLEKIASQQEIAALKKQVATLEKEKKQLEREGNELAEKFKAGMTKFRQIIRVVEKSRQVVRVAGKKLAALTPNQPHPLKKFDQAGPSKIPDLVKTIFRTMAIRAGEARAVTAKRRNIPRPGGGFTPVMEVRLGGIATLWRALDGSGTGWLTPAGKRVNLPPTQSHLGREIDRAIEILQRRQAPAITVLPLPGTTKKPGESQ